MLSEVECLRSALLKKRQWLCCVYVTATFSKSSVFLCIIVSRKGNDKGRKLHAKFCINPQVRLTQTFNLAVPILFFYVAT